MGNKQENKAEKVQQRDAENTGFDGTTNEVSEDRRDIDGYQIAIEDTMIGYDGDESQLDMDLGDTDAKPQNNAGVDDND